MATLPEAEEEPITPVTLLTELTGDGLRDMGDGVPVLLETDETLTNENFGKSNPLYSSIISN